jgi:hypothetical protein
MNDGLPGVQHRAHSRASSSFIRTLGHFNRAAEIDYCVA